MITIKRDTKWTGSLKALLAVAFGVYLIVTKANAMTLVVQIFGAGVLAVGVFPLLLSLKYPSMSQYASGAVVKILIAVLLLMLAGPISGIVRYILGGILCLFGASQILTLLSLRSSIVAGFWPFALPVILFLLGLMFFSEELIGKDIMGQIAGLAFIIYGVSKGLTTWNVGMKKSAQSQYTQFEDNSVDEQ